MSTPQDAWRRAHADELLTAAEVESLVTGDRVEMIWTGGNGPATYAVFCEGSTTYAVAGDITDTNPLLRYNPITFVGKEPFHTNVRLVADPKVTDG